jgi:segregation and condensation protein B
MDEFDVKPILESLFFVSDSPIRLEVLAEILPEASKEAILEGIRRIQEEYGDPSKGIELTEIAGGYQFRTKPGWAEWVNRLKKTKAVKLSQAALETLAIVAYRQPVIRPAIEEIRGVDSGSVLHTLMERGLIKMMGRKDLPGRPIVYGTSKAFLELFGLNSLSDLPKLQEIQPPPAPEEISRQEMSSQEISPQEISSQEISPEETSKEEILATETDKMTASESLTQSPSPPIEESQGGSGQN